MGRAGDARVVVTDRLLALSDELVTRKVETFLNERTQVRFDATALQLESAEPGDVAASGDSPKVDVRPGGVQLELAGTSDAPLGTTGSIVNLKFRAVAPRPAVLVSTQVIVLGEDGMAMAATPGTPLKIVVSQ